MNKNLFRICKILNWIIPVFWALFLVYNGDMSNYASYAVFFILGYAAFAFFRYQWNLYRSHWTYQSFFFAGYLIGLYNLLTSYDTVWEKGFHDSSSDIALSIKIIATLVTVFAFASKIITLIGETPQYNAESYNRYKRKHNYKLDSEVDHAVSKIATARNFREKQKAEAELEHAKYMREQYGYKDE